MEAQKIPTIKKSTRQAVLEEIKDLESDFRLFWVLRHEHELIKPLTKMIAKLVGLRELLKYYPERRCGHCGETLN